jgi:hypothetical protein
VHLYYLPYEYWDEEIFVGIRNTLGTIVKTTKATKQGRYISYTRICIYMNVSMSIRESIFLNYQDIKWVQTLNYEFIPFCYHHCHEHDHRFREYPIINPPKKTKLDIVSDEGFVKVPSRNRAGRHTPHMDQ